MCAVWMESIAHFSRFGWRDQTLSILSRSHQPDRHRQDQRGLHMRGKRSNSISISGQSRCTSSRRVGLVLLPCCFWLFSNECVRRRLFVGADSLVNWASEGSACRTTSGCAPQRQHQRATENSGFMRGAASRMFQPSPSSSPIHPMLVFAAFHVPVVSHRPGCVAFLRSLVWLASAYMSFAGKLRVDGGRLGSLRKNLACRQVKFARVLLV